MSTPTTTGAPRPLTLAVVSAGMSDASSTSLLADRLTGAVREALSPVPVRVERIELRPLAHAIADHLLTGFPGPQLAQALAVLDRADAVVAATPTYQASYSGLFKSFADLVGADVLEDVPVLVAATGGSARHSLVLDTALRPLFTHLRALVLPVGVYAATEDWAGPELETRIRRAGAQLARHLAPAAQGAPGSSGTGGAAGGPGRAGTDAAGGSGAAGADGAPGADRGPAPAGPAPRASAPSGPVYDGTAVPAFADLLAGTAR
ncbi:NAD(P)H-dependent oxidoreductase [Kocuria sp. LUK]|uniref:CE1759 family FMN reductase n=1 Tax=Kocuria sp. LUK TaxID=2897828 RepID=UPI001E4A4668|nr:CE1759 family FMN reductase [Kocuria sp. LUK]MCD1145230.1 NAD(P)H-dependent oxidoreductase [Kocuria sp. LUK]